MRRAITATLAGTAVVLAGCSAPPPPDVTFYTDGESAIASPMGLCEVGKDTCLQDQDAAVTLPTRKGQPVQISVSSKVADSPWGVVFSYVDRDGQQMAASSRLISDGSLSYTLVPPPEAELLIYVEVQKLRAVQGKLVETGIWGLTTRQRA
ncbi:DUF2771 family protein [Actinokineospora globicatena]|uniref:DUF2771 family protein n=1 Tax=Actinokineospora globicatena TaxID=103729 RepID=UPI0020A27423|nr:DUF2771 family protein [Actinokineospora globicatena]MCP2300774.1 Protein of unknown function (DUF2771) [Actinokineospora globicatena]GLW77601.1 hypothetical protein Aglo01_20830 [Actinokineospora globicatena]GLW84435.1 hypothetical protein Aglo02_20750 [Actinokineospora globicatena]